MRPIIFFCRNVFFYLLLQTVSSTQVFAQPGTTTKADNTYGPGGNKITKITTDSIVGHDSTVQIKDAKNITREYHNRQIKIDNSKL